MPDCAAVDCKNSAKKGFLMKHFTKDVTRRKHWSIQMERNNWTPTDYSCLCEIHFAPEMWEKTHVDGTRKLKVNAVLTIFSFSKPEKKRKPPTSRARLVLRKKSEKKSVLSGEIEDPVKMMTNSKQASHSNDNELVPSMSFAEISVEISSKDVSEISSENSIIANDRSSAQPSDVLAKLEKYEKMYYRERKRSTNYKGLLRNASNKVKKK